MALVKVGTLAQLGPGSVMEAVVDGQPYAVCNAAGEVYALEGACPHRGGPLGHGEMDGHRVVCPWHLWEFDCRTGAYDRDPGVRVAAVPVRVEDGDILLEVP